MRRLSLQMKDRQQKVVDGGVQSPGNAAGPKFFKGMLGKKEGGASTGQAAAADIPGEEASAPPAGAAAQASASVGVAGVEKATHVRWVSASLSQVGFEPEYKKENQDNCFAYDKYITSDQGLFCVMDGHGPFGHRVSDFVKRKFPEVFAECSMQFTDPKQALTSTFLTTDRGLDYSGIDTELSGSTCVVVYIAGRTLHCAWVGDSRAVLCQRDPATNKRRAVNLIIDHKPFQPEEKARVERCGGRVARCVDDQGQEIGPFRVWMQLPVWAPGLAMSRALGDKMAHSIGVISKPDLVSRDITVEDEFIIIATDGVWEFISSEEAVALVTKQKDPKESCQALVDLAYQRWIEEEEGIVDDISCVVIFLAT
jgi:serine/threonine protein phosphatase PrpC